MEIKDGIYFVFLNGRHILTKKIQNGKGKTYLPYNLEVPIPHAEFSIEGRATEIVFTYGCLPFNVFLKPISRVSFKGKAFLYGNEWFDLLLIKYEE